MKKTINLVVVALMAIGMLSCGEKKVTEEELKQTEASLMNDDMTANTEAMPAAVDQFCKYVEQNPDAATAPDWLFKAFDVSLRQNDVKKSEELCDKLVNDYPKFDKTPAAMFMMAMYVYQVNDIDKARAMYEKIIADYPETKWASDAKVMVDNYLGMTDEQIMNIIESGQVKMDEAVAE